MAIGPDIACRTPLDKSSEIGYCNFMKILFICSSNVCRSPFAEFYFGRIVSADPVLKENIEWIKSGAVLNQSFVLHQKARATLLKEGFSESELSEHKPVFWLFGAKRFREADVIIGMSRVHRHLLPFWWRKKYVTLSEAATGKYEQIPDPFLIREQEKYDEAMEPIKKYLEQYAEKLRSELTAKA